LSAPATMCHLDTLTTKESLMSAQYTTEKAGQSGEDLRRQPLLALDELLLLRSIHGKLEGYRMLRRERPEDSDGALDPELLLLW
jgi:hypothetical protein